jgi:hypothetical protein
MTWLVNAINRLIELKRETMVDVEGRHYSTLPLHAVDDPELKTIVTHTLAGLISFIGSTDRGEALPKFVHVVDHKTVHLMSDVHGNHPGRSVMCSAIYERPESMAIGRQLSIEEFIVGIRCGFVQDEQTAMLLKIVGNIKDGAVRQLTDDGITQQVTAKRGVALAEDVRVPGTVLLRPFRTFAEIEQPQQEYVIRLRSGADGEMPTAALHEVASGNWKLAAILGISEWITKLLPKGIGLVA